MLRTNGQLLMATLGDLVANLGINASRWNRGLGLARAGLGAFVGAANAGLSAASGAVSRFLNVGGGIGNFVGKLGMISMGIGAIKSAIGTLAWPLSLAGNAEKTQIAFSTMLKSADKAKVLVAELNQFAASTPFEQPEIVDAGRKLLAFGVEAKHIIPTLTALGDVAAGIDQPIGELAELFGKSKVQGKLMAEDINQLTGRGIPIITELAKVFKKPETAIKKMVENGQVNFGHLQKAFASMAGKGGQFAGLMDAQSRSTMGLWSTLKDNLGQTFTAIGAALIEGFNFKGLMTSTIGFLETFKTTWLPGIAATISAVGSRFGAFFTWLGTVWSNWFTNSQASLMAWGDAFMGAWSQFLSFAGDLLGWFGDVFQGVATLFGTIWNAVFGRATGSMQFMVRNWYTLLQIALQNVVLFASNAWKHLQAFFQNLFIWMEWWPNNWQKVMLTLGSLLSTLFINMAKNVGSFFKALWDFAKGKGFKFDSTPMTEGFKNSIDQLPDLVSAAVDKSTPELDRLYNKLNADEAAFQKQQADRALATQPKAKAPDMPTPKALTLGDIATKNGDQVGQKKQERQKLDAVEAHTAEAFRTVLAGTNQGPRSPEEKMVANTDRGNKLLTELLLNGKKQLAATKSIKPPRPAKLPS